MTQPPATRLRATLLGTGSSLPPQIIPNSYFVDSLGLDTTAAWIESRTGILRRRFAAPQVTASALATDAAHNALEQAGTAAEELDLIIVATSTPDYTMPSTACLVQRELGATNAMAFDLSNACAGFVFALDAAIRYLQTDFTNALVIGVDLGSRLVDPQERTTSVFFGDGAGAVVLSSNGPGIVRASCLHSRGDHQSLNVPVGGEMTMDGRAIWDFAVDVLPATFRELCANGGITTDDVALLVPHQANLRILRTAAHALDFPMDRVAVNLHEYGNTLAASVPIALDESLRSGQAGPGDHVMLISFGAGLAWGGSLLTL